MHPSSQSSQDTLQEGSRTVCRSIMMNFGCIALKGRMKIDLICRSRPASSEGSGKPSFDFQVEGGHGLPPKERVWKIFCKMESEEKQIRTRILWSGPLARTVAESFRRMERRVSRDFERAQKQVTMTSSCCVESKVDAW